MREIKFRAWNDIDKMMIDWSFFKACPVTFMGIVKGKIKHHRIMQFTGLQDSNGVDIYEGDIVEESRLLSCGVRKTNLEVKYKAPSFCVGDLELSNFMGITRKVIGNIYENPELLESNPAYRGDDNENTNPAC